MTEMDALWDEKPPLYDITRIWVQDGKEIKRESKRGLYDYDRNVFVVPSNLMKMFEYRRKDDLAIMRSVGICEAK